MGTWWPHRQSPNHYADGGSGDRTAEILHLLQWFIWVLQPALAHCICTSAGEDVSLPRRLYSRRSISAWAMASQGQGHSVLSFTHWGGVCSEFCTVYDGISLEVLYILVTYFWGLYLVYFGLTICMWSEDCTFVFLDTSFAYDRWGLYIWLISCIWLLPIDIYNLAFVVSESWFFYDHLC